MHSSKVIISSLNVKSLQVIPKTVDSLQLDETIIYNIHLPNFINIKNDLAKYLTSNEILKAKKFHKEIDKTRFIIYKSILKFILAAHVKVDVNDIILDLDYNKKPYLASHPSLYFNISHSQDFALIAISRKKVGIDIEQIVENFDFTNLLSGIFSNDEIDNIENNIQKTNAFYNSWTRKEAFVKALGKGIDDDFKHIPCLDGHHLLSSDIIQNNQNWQVYSFEFDNRYAGAICFEGISTASKELLVYTVPNTLKDLSEMVRKKNFNF